MKTRFTSVLALFLMAVSASGQLVPDGGTAVIDGVTNTVTGVLTVGTNTGNTTLILTNAGRVISDGGTIGSAGGSRSNLVLITGPGSVWTNSATFPLVIIGASGANNRLIVTNGGALVVDGPGGAEVRLGFQAGGSNNSMLVTGPGSLTTTYTLVVGQSGANNELTIQDGGVVSVGHDVYVSGSLNSTNNKIRVMDGGMLLVSNLFILGEFTRGNNSLLVSTGGKVTNGVSFFGGDILFSGNTNNVVLITDPGSVWHSRTGLVIGVTGGANQLIISNSALVRVDGDFFVGSNSFGNLALVTDRGSELNLGGNTEMYVGPASSGNQLIVTNGGRVVNPYSIVIGGSNNLIEVTGLGSVWIGTNNVGGIGRIIVGPTSPDPGQNARLIVEDGGQVFLRSINVSLSVNSSNDAVIVRDSGSLLSVRPLLFNVGKGELTISNSATVVAQGGLRLGSQSPCQSTVSAGYLIVTNAAGNSLFNLIQGTNLFDGGIIVADLLRLTNGGNSVFQFHSGTLKSANTVINNGSPFFVGNGVGAAVFRLSGGTHTFNQGLVISSNAVVQGCGTVNGAVTVQPGGTVLSDCTNLVFIGTVTNHGTLLALNSSTLHGQGLVVNQGVIDIIEGTTNFTGGFINHGVVLTPADVRISEASVSGNDLVVRLPSFIGHTFQLQRRDSIVSGSWTNFDEAQAGTGDVLTFIDPGSLTNTTERFYRIGVVP